MLRYARNLLVTVIAYWLGVVAAGAYITNTTLEEISKNVPSFDGKMVQVESYAWVYDDAEAVWTIGEPYEKPEAGITLDVSSVPLVVRDLEPILHDDRFEHQYNRIKVRVTGTINDNCNRGVTCCFGPSISMKVESMAPIDQVERYSEPERIY